MENDYILKNNRRYFRVFCPTCGKDKGYKRKESAKRPCYSCNGKKANKASLLVRVREKNICSHKGCNLLEDLRGMCREHYERYRRPPKSRLYKCEICNKSMQAKSAKKKYCSKACNSSAWRSRHPSYLKNRLKNNINAKIASNLRTRIGNAIKGKVKVGSAVKDLGCTLDELKIYLEGKFQDGMNWKNYGNWHIDHIKPLSLFNLSDPIELKQACHYSNLQPMWASDNLRKSNKYDE
jgi:hypothetical protein